MSRVEILLRQQRLVLRSAQLRHVITDQAQALERPLALFDQLRGGVRWLGQHPLLPVAALVVLVLLRPMRVLRWGAWLWSMGKLSRQLGEWARQAGLAEWLERGGRDVRSR